MNEKYLPIGTVVLLKGGTKKVMISGFCAVTEEQTDKMYDYSGCMYPEGFLSSNQTCLFNHNQIEKVYFIGYRDEEEIAFKKKLNDSLPQIKEQLKKMTENNTTQNPQF